MRWYYWLLLVALLILAYDAIRSLIKNYQRSKRQKRHKSILDKVELVDNIFVHPITEDESYIAGVDPYMKAAMGFEKGDTELVGMRLIDKHGVAHDEFLEEPIIIYEGRQKPHDYKDKLIDEREKEQLLLSLVVGVANHKRSVEILQSITTKKLDEVITKDFGDRADTPYVDSFSDKSKERLIKGIQTFSEKSLEFVDNKDLEPDTMRKYVSEKVDEPKGKWIQGYKEVDPKDLKDFVDPDIPAKEDTPEDYLRSIIFENGKWVKKTSK